MENSPLPSKMAFTDFALNKKLHTFGIDREIAHSVTANYRVPQNLVFIVRVRCRHRVDFRADWLVFWNLKISKFNLPIFSILD